MKDRREKGNENLFEEKMAENFTNLLKKKVIQVQKVQRVPNKMDPKRPTPRHITVKMSKVKDKERNLNAARGKRLVTYKGICIRLSAYFSVETLQGRRECMIYLKCSKEETSN